MVSVINGTTSKPISSDHLVKFFTAQKELTGYLYIGYPVIGTAEGRYPIDAMWISESHDIIIFNLVEGAKVDETYKDIQDDAVNKVEAKLKMHKQLVRKRKLCVNINVITYAPAIKRRIDHDDEYPLCINDSELMKAIHAVDKSDGEYFKEVVSILQSISRIRKGVKKRIVGKKTSRAAKLQCLEDSIANLDNNQSKAVIETVEGVQRIRGLAGSGKTIVLALKAAYLHAQHPEWKIAVTFNTRSLKGQLRQLINSFYYEQTGGEEPDWENLHILHAWGAQGGGEKNGVYYKFCMMNGTNYYDYKTAKYKFETEDPFGGACNEALASVEGYETYYDVILVDEAQDFSPAFLRICYEMLKEPKRLVYAYDELQNLRVQSLPSPEEIFGNDDFGKPRVSFNVNGQGSPQADIILEKCYRNSRPALVTAHALGFGIYRKTDVGADTGIVQMFEHRSLWQDIGYEVIDGSLNDGEHVVLNRTSKSSPKFLEEHSPIDDLVMFKSFDTIEEQNLWVANEIKKNISEDELRPDDIIVINPNPFTTKNMVAPIRALLYKADIQSHTAGIDTAPDVFFAENNDSIAFTGIYRAKGNEAAMVYVINAQDCYDSAFDLAKIRNRLFTAITRSKAWVRVVGVGKNMNSLIEEYEMVKGKKFTLDFVYPTAEQRAHMNIVNRDMSEGEKKGIRQNKNNINKLIEDLKSQRIYPEDLDEGEKNELIKLLRGEA